MASVAILAQNIQKKDTDASSCGADWNGWEQKNKIAARKGVSGRGGGRKCGTVVDLGGGDVESAVLSSIWDAGRAKVPYCRRLLPTLGKPRGGPNPHGLCDTFGGVDFGVPKSVAQAVRIEHAIEKVPYRPHGFRGQSEHAESAVQATTLSSGEPFKVDLGWVVR